MAGSLMIKLLQQTDMWVSNAKASFFTKGILDAFDVIYQILGKILFVSACPDQIPIHPYTSIKA